MLNQPTNISPDEVNGTGTVDVSQGIEVSWRVSGDSAVVAYQIVIMDNDAASTTVFDTGKVTLSTPFWGTDYKGNVQYMTVTIGGASLSGVTNGNEYKMLITQWWSADDSVTQTTASVFITRSTPTVTLATIPAPLTEKEYSFTATYAQAEGDPMKWVRWQIAYPDSESAPFLDTGNIYGTGELQVDFDGFLTNTSYAVRCTVETANGVSATTGWEEFDVEYNLPAATGTASACQLANNCCVWVTWDEEVSADGYSIMRQTVGDNRLVKIADVESTVGQIRDYSAKSGSSYIYYVFPTGALAYLTQPMATDIVNVQYWFWSIIEAASLADAENSYEVVAIYNFRYNVSEGSFSNNNSPQLTPNFTKYPTRQGMTSNYLTGTLTGYIGTISRDSLTYSDTITQSDAIFALSNSENALFLIDPKGNFRKIHTSAAISLQRDNKKVPMPQSMTVTWAEVGPTEDVHVIAYAGGDFYPNDRVILTTIAINTASGALEWTVPDDYAGTGSVLALENGVLTQSTDGSYDAATMEIDDTTKILSATLGG